ncbi:hypothetical protein GW17_00035252 [Ensete ventricosum]|nr:hypothetical protein GW17_00035252 [Ensete ventricosum]
MATSRKERQLNYGVSLRLNNSSSVTEEEGRGQIDLRDRLEQLAEICLNVHSQFLHTGCDPKPPDKRTKIPTQLPLIHRINTESNALQEGVAVENRERGGLHYDTKEDDQANRLQVEVSSHRRPRHAYGLISVPAVLQTIEFNSRRAAEQKMKRREQKQTKACAKAQTRNTWLLLQERRYRGDLRGGRWLLHGLIQRERRSQQRDHKYKKLEQRQGRGLDGLRGLWDTVFGWDCEATLPLPPSPPIYLRLPVSLSSEVANDGSFQSGDLFPALSLKLRQSN